MSRHPNIILIVLDALRLDRSDHIRASLPGFVKYENVVTTAPWTLPSHVSMFTGLYPSEHGSHETEEWNCTDISTIRNTKPTINKGLRDLGYTTYAFSGNILVSPTYGFDFDVFEQPRFSFPWPLFLDRLSTREARLFKKLLVTRKPADGLSFLLGLSINDPSSLAVLLRLLAQQTANKVTGSWPKQKGGKQALDFVKKEKFEQPFFLFVNLLEIHEPYFKSDDLLKGLTPRPVDSVEPTRLRNWTKGYDSQLRILRENLSEILGTLRARGLLEHTIVIVTSDHGQLLGEHGWIGHGSFLYDELIRVPLMISYPLTCPIAKVAPRGPVSLANLSRFVIDLANGTSTDSELYSTEAFAESWGLYEPVPSNRTSLLARHTGELMSRRICIYKDEAKVTYNFTQKRVEEVVSYNPGKKPDVDDMVGRCVELAKNTITKPSITSSETIKDEGVVMDRLRRLGYI